MAIELISLTGGRECNSIVVLGQRLEENAALAGANACLRWIGEFSAGLLSAVDFDVDKQVPGVLDDAPAVNKKLRLLWLGCGDADPRYNGYRNLADQLVERGLKVEVRDAEGGHEWKVWRHQLRDFLQVVFR